MPKPKIVIFLSDSHHYSYVNLLALSLSTLIYIDRASATQIHIDNLTLLTEFYTQSRVPWWQRIGLVVRRYVPKRQNNRNSNSLHVDIDLTRKITNRMSMRSFL